MREKEGEKENLAMSLCHSTNTLVSMTYLSSSRIVAIHGVNEHREETWTVYDINWLRRFLPSDIPSARIYSWGYNDDNHKNSKIYPHHLYEHAEHLISDLNLRRKATKV